MSKNDLSISLIPLALRRMNGVKTVSSGAVNRTIPQDEFVEGCARYQKEAAARKESMPTIVDGLWRCEGLSTTFGKYRLPENTLNDSRIPREAYGITHVGYGAASTEHARFDTAKLIEIVETMSEPNYRGFTYEGIGSILRIYEPGIFKFMCEVMGLIPHNAPPGPDRQGFYLKYLSAYPTEVQRLITHGYGRLVAFSKLSVYAAIEEAMQLPPAFREPAVQGIAFAFAMMNAVEMPRLLENSALDGAARAPFQNGLVYSVVFCDWFAPGFLATWKPAGKLEEKLLARAVEESAKSFDRGYILPLQLENRLT